MSAACLSTNCDSRSYAQKMWRSGRQAIMTGVARLPKVFSDVIVISDLQLEIVAARLPAGARVHRVANPAEAPDLGPKPDHARARVFPSRWIEGQPLTVLEAKALGTPVVVSDACAGRESIEDGRSGLWFRSGDPEALAAALTRIKDDPLVGRLSGEAYRAYWADPPTPERHAAALLAVYEGMVGRRAPGDRTESASSRKSSMHFATTPMS